jgi:hypothetical protein
MMSRAEIVGRQILRNSQRAVRWPRALLERFYEKTDAGRAGTTGPSF